MQMYLLTNGGIRPMSLPENKSTHAEVVHMEQINSSINDARLHAIELLADLEQRQRLNKPQAITALQKAAASYESIINSLQPATKSGHLRHFYKKLQRTADRELANVKQMLETVLTGDNDKFNEYYQRYVSLLSL